MTTLVRRDRGIFPELFDLLERPAHSIRFEDFIRDGRYVLRAELPGIDPAKDVEITLARGILTVRAERHHEDKQAHRTEFRYGAFNRSIALPPDVDDKDVRATYDKGILEVTVKLEDAKRAGRRIPIDQGKR